MILVQTSRQAGKIETILPSVLYCTLQ